MAAKDDVRLLINDKAKTMFTDDADILSFLSLNNDSIYLAASAALDSIIAKMSLAESFTIGSYSERANLSALKELSAKYKQKAADSGLNDDGTPMVYDDVAEVVATEFNLRDIVINQAIKDSI